MRLKAGHRSSKPIAWMNFIAVSQSRFLFLLICLAPFCVPGSVALQLDARVFSALSARARTHTQTHEPRAQTDATQWLGEREDLWL